MKTTAPHFTLGPTSTRLGAVAPAAAEFAGRRAIVGHDALDAALVAKLDRICDAAEFRSDHVERLGHRRIETPRVAGSAIALLLNRAPLFRWLEAVTGCATIGGVDGRVVQTYAEPGDELVWHNDLEGARRLLAVTVALTSPVYAGGTFELREVGAEDLLFSHTHDRPGSVVVFDVSSRLEHRVLPLSAGGPRRVFTGWFVAA